MSRRVLSTRLTLAAVAAAAGGALLLVSCSDAPTKPIDASAAKAAGAAAASAANKAAEKAAEKAADKAPGVHRQYGTPVKVGDGRARSYIVIDQKARTTIEIGIALDERALDGLPMANTAPDASPGEHMGSFAYLLPLPAQNATPIQLVELDWNAMGHEPPGIYNVPHFDFHFYTISLVERNAITPADPNFAAKSANFPAPATVPPGYMVLPPPPAPVQAVPMMGVHWSNPASPELQPPGSPNRAPFTRTFIYGSWDGRFIFAEPMVTRAYLLSHPDDVAPISMTSVFPGGGFAPTAYRVQYDAQAKEYRVALVVGGAR